MKQRFNLDVRPFHEVISIDAEQQTVTVKTPTGELIESYDKLILSPGAKPVIPNLSGIEEANNLFTLRNVPDLDKIMIKLDQIKSGHVVVIGAGFIGLEMAENLALKAGRSRLSNKLPMFYLLLT